MDHPNIVSLKHCFFSTTSQNELFLNLVMEYVPESMFRVLKHYSDANHKMPLIYVKLYTYQVSKITPYTLFRVQLGAFCFNVTIGICSADLQRFGLHAFCCWCLPQRLEAPKCFGRDEYFCIH